MDNLKPNNRLGNRSPLIQSRNTTLGSANNVLQPNKLKTSRLIANNLYREDKNNRISNINNGSGLMNRGWNTKG